MEAESFDSVPVPRTIRLWCLGCNNVIEVSTLVHTPPCRTCGLTIWSTLQIRPLPSAPLWALTEDDERFLKVIHVLAD